MVLIEISRWVPRASPALLNPLVLHDPPARRDSSDDRRRTYDFELSAAVTSPSFLSLHVAFCLGHPLRLPCSPFSTPGMFSSVEGNHLHSCTHALRGPPPRSIPRSLWSMPPQAFRDVYRTWALASWSVVRGAPICLCHSISRHALPSLWLGRPTFSKRVNCLVRLGVWRVRIELPPLPHPRLLDRTQRSVGGEQELRLFIRGYAGDAYIYPLAGRSHGSYAQARFQLLAMLGSLVALAALAAQVSAHYTFPSLIVNGKETEAWVNVRKTNNHYSQAPVTDVTSADFRCYTSQTNAKAETIDVAAGSTLGIACDQTIYHPGVVNVYMARAPTGKPVADWDGAGRVWFKTHEITAVTDGGKSITFPAEGVPSVNFTVPRALPSGEYLVRMEAIALHSAERKGGAQFYISCGQINVTGGGSGTPSPLVEIPGVYTGEEPGIMIDINWPIPQNYTQPGPAVWRG